MQGIYRILNLINDMWYVGSAKDIRARWESHKGALRKGCDSPHLQNAFNKYGASNFVLEILREVKGSRKDAFDREQEYLDEWMPTGQLYNIMPVACGDFEKHTDESRAKISVALKGKKHTKEHKANVSAAKMGTECSAKPYPSFFNIFTGEVIPTGRNLSKLCRERGLCLESMRMVVKGIRKHAYGCWVLNTDEAKVNVRLYPPFFNVKTGQTIPTCTNLTKLCREHGLNYANMANLARGTTKQSYDGWRKAAEQESL